MMGDGWIRESVSHIVSSEAKSGEYYKPAKGKLSKDKLKEKYGISLGQEAAKQALNHFKMMKNQKRQSIN